MQSLVSAVLLLCAVALVSLVKARDSVGSALQLELNSLLGLQPNQTSHMKKEDLPQFMVDMYSCMSSTRSENCRPFYQNEEVNLIRTSLGTVNNSTSEVLHKYRPQIMKNSVEIKFNISLFNRHVEKVHHSMLRLHRHPLTSDQLRSLQKKCGGDNITLQLYSYSGWNNGLHKISLRAIQPLQILKLRDEGWVEFLNITQMFTSFLNDSDGSPSRQWKLRLAVQCLSVAPYELGFVFNSTKYRPQLVEFIGNDKQKDFNFSTVMSFLMRLRLQHDRSKRETSTTEEKVPEQTTAEPLLSNSSSKASIQENLEQLPTDHTYRSRSCTLYSYQIPFGNPAIIHPSSYNANICAGLCHDHPSSNIKNHHAYLQSIAHRYYADKVPAPCCVPRPGTLEPFRVLTSGGDSTVEARNFPDMIATACECL